VRRSSALGLLPRLKYDPLPGLLAAEEEALLHFARRDLLDDSEDSPLALWDLPVVRRTLGKQELDGSWTSRSSRVKPGASNYRLIETWKALRILVDMYGMSREHPALGRAAEYVLSCQTEEGDLRGFIGNQYATYYTGALLGLLIRAGYGDDARVTKGMEWLLSMRQDDGGWSVPIITHGFNGKRMYELTTRVLDPVKPDRSRPFSHNANGMVLRAFAAHATYRAHQGARAAATLQKTRFFEKDRYSSYQSADYWVKFQYPFWWNNLVASLDAISMIDDTVDAPMERAIGWLVENQQRDGLWNTTYAKGGIAGSQSPGARLWVTLAICRILKRIHGRPAPVTAARPPKREMKEGASRQ
jgi:hypothetical protein